MNSVGVIIKFDGVFIKTDGEAKNNTQTHQIIVNNTTYNSEFNEFVLF